MSRHSETDNTTFSKTEIKFCYSILSWQGATKWHIFPYIICELVTDNDVPTPILFSSSSFQEIILLFLKNFQQNLHSDPILTE